MVFRRTRVNAALTIKVDSTEVLVVCDNVELFFSKREGTRFTQAQLEPVLKNLLKAKWRANATSSHRREDAVVSHTSASHGLVGAIFELRINVPRPGQNRLNKRSFDEAFNAYKQEVIQISSK